jgi:hypothetical protein
VNVVTDAELVEPLTGTAILNGVTVSVELAERAAVAAPAPPTQAGAG